MKNLIRFLLACLIGFGCTKQSVAIEQKDPLDTNVSYADLLVGCWEHTNDHYSWDVKSIDSIECAATVCGVGDSAGYFMYYDKNICKWVVVK